MDKMDKIEKMEIPDDMVKTKDGKLILKSKACRSLLERQIVVGEGEHKVTKTILAAHDVVYLKDEKTGCLLRCGERKLGKSAQRAAKKAKVAVRKSGI